MEVINRLTAGQIKSSQAAKQDRQWIQDQEDQNAKYRQG